MPQWGVTRLSCLLLGAGCTLPEVLAVLLGRNAKPLHSKTHCPHPRTHLPACRIIQQGALSTCSPRAARTMRGTSASATAAGGAWARTTTTARLLLLPGRTCTLPAPPAWLRVCSCVCCILEQAGWLLAAGRGYDHSTCATVTAAVALQLFFLKCRHTDWDGGIK